MKKTGIIVLLIYFFCGSSAQITQWRGENRDGKFLQEKNLLKAWPEGGPQLLLQVENLGKGYSSPIFDGTTIYISGMKDTIDYLTALDMTGKIKWQVPYGRSWVKSFPETRSSPTIEGDRVYVLSGTGKLSCLNKADGKTIWSVGVDADYESEWHIWGVSESPLIVEDKVICSPGGNLTSIVALDKMTGKEIWRTEPVGGPRCYISPAIYEYQKFRFIIAATGQHLMAIVPETGKVAWSYKYWDSAKWDQNGLIWANTPIWNKDEFFITMGYDYKPVMLKMNADGTGVTEKYSPTIFDNHHHGVVLVDGFVYGSNWINNGKGNWVCMNWDSGEIKWETTWENKGAVVYADGMLYLYEEKRGNVGLVKPNPEKFELVSSFQVKAGTGPHWAHPFIRDGKLFLRHGEVLQVYKIN
ncbi:MAG TPA: PQQ-like beta-propeller repeat protein [Prolixibacteraceae bacterium]|nr:PQQ-like beta-propeller repeat protein [Prolixibacteraceae bacterium]